MKQYSDTLGMSERKDNQSKTKSARREVLGEVYGRSMGGLRGGVTGGLSSLFVLQLLNTKEFTENDGRSWQKKEKCIFDDWKIAKTYVISLEPVVPDGSSNKKCNY